MTLTPTRIQRKRAKGWKMPEGCVYVGRGSRWGNIFIPGQAVTRRYFDTMVNSIVFSPRDAVVLYHSLHVDRPDMAQWLAPLMEAKYLACWCRPGQPCHADVLIKFIEKVRESNLQTTRASRLAISRRLYSQGVKQLD